MVSVLVRFVWPTGSCCPRPNSIPVHWERTKLGLELQFPQTLEHPNNSPGEDDEKVQPVPVVAQVGALPSDAHGHHLDGHLEGEEGEDDVVEGLRDATARRGAALVLTRLVHAQRDTIEQYGYHADALEPCVAHPNERRGVKLRKIIIESSGKAFHNGKKNFILLHRESR